MGIGDDLQAGIGAVGEFITENPISVAIGAGVVAAGAGIGLIALAGSKSKKKTRRSHKRDRIFKSKQKHERRYKRKKKYKIYGRKGWIHPIKRKNRNSGKHTRKRSGKVYYARKSGQPYILLANGKAKFIKGKRRK